MNTDPSSPLQAQSTDYTANTNYATSSAEVTKDPLTVFFNGIRYLCGFAFLGLGSYLLIFILREVYQAYQNIGNNGFVVSLINWLADHPIFYDSNNEHAFVLGRAGATIVAVVLACMVASMALKAAFSFFTAGMRLLQIKSSTPAS